MLILWDFRSRVFGQTFSATHVLIAAGIVVVLGNGKTFGLERGPGGSSPGTAHYEVVYPSRVDGHGRFVSDSVSHRISRVQRRDTSSGEQRPLQVFYQLHHGGRDLHLNLTLNPHLLAPGFLMEHRYGGLEGAKIRSRGQALCHFIGQVWERTTVRGGAAISTCDGLTGLFKLSEEEFFIQPLEAVREEGTPQAHMIYKRHITEPEGGPVPPLPGDRPPNGACGVLDTQRRVARAERRREQWEARRGRRRIRQRSVSTEKWVETLVVADPKMVEYHGSEGVENYVLAIMNIVAGLFRHASIGNSINIVVVRLIVLEHEEEDLKISHHADNSLNSFCKWQKRLNMKGDDHPTHHDVAVLLTRKDICAAMNKPCETLGLSHVAGMCQPHRSCSISEDTGLPLAFTVAHELGHNFGIQHDGSGNDCEPVGKRPFIMAPQLLYGTAPPSWSRCSRQYITRFLDRGWGWCLDDAPAQEEPSLRSAPPGVLYSTAHQCRLQYGTDSLLCDDVDNVCSTLWCTVGNTCHSKLDGAVDGTKCGEDKWCYGGECVAVGSRPESVNGGWAAWSVWSACSRTCGAGVQNAQRDCSDPVPAHGGRYCLGERRRYRICNATPCPPNQPPFRHVQCSQFNTMPYKGQFYKWVQVNNRVNPCELHCRPVHEYFSEKLLDAVIDGTQCYEGTSRRDMCINGICKSVGCDYEIDSSAVEDRCGVCHGNGSTCETVKKTFEKSEGLGYVDVGLIPEGAWDIRVEEVAEAGNFLALRSNDSEKYFLNGGWTIQWNGEYKAGGTVFTYERTGHLENLTSPGPTLEPVWIQLLFQETNPGVRYEYTISREPSTGSNNDSSTPDFLWQYRSWTECSATCGTGVQRQVVQCVERTAGVVEDRYCDLGTRPDDKQASCNEELCPAMWWAGEWQECSSTCGEAGLTKRTVLCIQSVGLEEQRALHPSECQHLPRPESVTPCNTHLPCPSEWTTSNWSQCSETCGGGLRRRNVTCARNAGVDCDSRRKPSAVAPCYVQDCPAVEDWSGSGSSSQEKFDEVNTIPDGSSQPKPGTVTPIAHPNSNHSNLNDIMEGGGFPHKNSIDTTVDNSIKNNVLVDDFYYDYNFIKFHEDLSYDPSTEKDGENEGGDGEKDEEIEHGEEPSPTPLGSVTSSPTTTSLKPVSMPTDLPVTVSTPGSTTKVNHNAVGVLDLNSTADQESNTDWEEEAIYAEDHFLPRPAGPTQSKQQHTPQPDAAPYWRMGNWSTCSTSCGLGATWRWVLCSTGEDTDCEASERPIPARRCYLRPCSTWRVGEWGQCNRNCGGGVRVREVLCSNTRDERPLRPFHCQAVAPRPSTRLPCNLQPCLDWYTSSWGQCSELCGGGEQQRQVICPESDKCDESLQPTTVQTCNNHSCAHWVTGAWGQCSVSCGGGLQHRLVKCVISKTVEKEEEEEEEEPQQCDHEPRPESVQKCHLPDCESTPPGQVCQRDRLTFRFCQTLKWLGRCHLPAVRTQCCKTCAQRSRGNERTSQR
ncbi:A disintegrin and metalloproteinase with thrombospondin motifs 7-like [Megalops cyprinoides]|uniref:A disintegrin and metalloproteinase with thrombospondin motifs 7-like n=1 Tax=Megalops cyprinoides TaxID=118141 RepID=UPI001863B096|nr:A disintegrin and metalloproteinase with thrombospondin motifs 7-like [Megalops cyprinoides]